jgi:hypothetical protein
MATATVSTDAIPANLVLNDGALTVILGTQHAVRELRISRRYGGPVTIGDLEEYWRQQERGPDWIEAQRTQGRAILEELWADFRGKTPEVRVLERIRQRQAAEREAELAARAAAKQARRDWWEQTESQREPAAIRARLGEGDPDERFTDAQAAEILCVPRKDIYTFSVSGRKTDRYLQTAMGRKGDPGGKYRYTTRRWILDRVERDERRIAERQEREREAREQEHEDRVLNAEGLYILCRDCDAVLGWRYGTADFRHTTYCVPCGEKRRAEAIARVEADYGVSGVSEITGPGTTRGAVGSGSGSAVCSGAG